MLQLFEDDTYGYPVPRQRKVPWTTLRNLGKMRVLTDFRINQIWLLTRCSILIIASILCFNPQRQRLQQCGKSTGISLFYVLNNLIVATGQFTVGIFLLVFEKGHLEKMYNPIGGWLNVIQYGVIWLCYLALFLYCLYLPPSRLREKASVSAGYLFFFTFALAVLVGVTTASSSKHHGWLLKLLGGPLLLCINAIILVAGIFSLFAQTSQIGPNVSRSALSIDGLLAQAVLFFVMGTSWVFRLVPPGSFYDEEKPITYWDMWIELVGWAVLDNLIFAFVQAALFCIARRRKDEVGTVDERTGLLAPG